MEFDPEECTAENDEELLMNVKKELHKHTLDSYGGAALLSTPAEDPDESDQARIENWEKLNKVFCIYCSNFNLHFLALRRLPENVDQAGSEGNIETNIYSIYFQPRKQLAITFREPLQPRKRGFTYESAYRNNPANFKRQYEEPSAGHYYANALFPVKNGSFLDLSNHFKNFRLNCRKSRH